MNDRTTEELLAIADEMLVEGHRLLRPWIRIEHWDDCSSRVSVTVGCTCGLADAHKALRERFAIPAERTRRET